MPREDRSYLTTFAALTSVFAVILVAIVAAVGKGATGDGSAATAAAKPVQVALSEYAITPAAITVPAGGSIDATNAGSMAHNLSIDGQNLKTPEIPGGGKGNLDLSSLAPGTYQMFCSVTGHKDLGMVGTVKVTPSAGGANPGAATSSGASADAGSAAMPGMSGASTSSGSTDVSTMKPGSAAAKKANAAMEKAMTGGVNTFLAYTKKYAAGTVKTGNARLRPKVLGDGTKEFDLTAAITKWEVSPGKVVNAWTYNGIAPGPWIKVDPGDRVKVVLRNKLPIATDIHFHGIDVPNGQDGVAPITQKYIEPGSTYTYSFTAPSTPQLGMYHAHMHGQVAIVNGLFAVFQVGDVALPKGRTVAGINVPADLKVTQEIPVVLNDAGVIGLSINGKAFPETAPIAAKRGDWVLIDYYNEGLQGHPMHLHRLPQLVVAKDGYPLTAPYRADTVWIGPGERYSILVKADEVGVWAFHCHIVSHAESDQGLTGMVTAFIVS